MAFSSPYLLIIYLYVYINYNSLVNVHVLAMLTDNSDPFTKCIDSLYIWGIYLTFEDGGEMLTSKIALMPTRMYLVMCFVTNHKKCTINFIVVPTEYCP